MEHPGKILPAVVPKGRHPKDNVLHDVNDKHKSPKFKWSKNDRGGRKQKPMRGQMSYGSPEERGYVDTYARQTNEQFESTNERSAYGWQIERPYDSYVDSRDRNTMPSYDNYRNNDRDSPPYRTYSPHSDRYSNNGYSSRTIDRKDADRYGQPSYFNDTYSRRSSDRRYNPYDQRRSDRGRSEREKEREEAERIKAENMQRRTEEFMNRVRSQEDAERAKRRNPNQQDDSHIKKNDKKSSRSPQGNRTPDYPQSPYNVGASSDQIRQDCRETRQNSRDDRDNHRQFDPTPRFTDYSIDDRFGASTDRRQQDNGYASNRVGFYDREVKMNECEYNSYADLQRDFKNRQSSEPSDYLKAVSGLLNKR